MDYVSLKPIIEAETLKMPAKEGIIAPADVWVRVGPTYQDPGKIGDFQRIGIQVKAVKGSLEVVKDFKLCSTGELVTATVSHMCRLLNIIPFEYSLAVKLVYNDGLIIPKEIIQLNPEDIQAGIMAATTNLTAISLEAGLPNSLAAPQMLMNTFKNILFLGAGADLKFPALEKALADAQNAQAQVVTKVEEKEEEKPKSESESEDISMGGMFD